MDIRKKFGIPTIQLTDNMKLQMKEDQSADASVLLRRRNKIIKGGRLREGPERERAEQGGKKRAE